MVLFGYEWHTKRQYLPGPFSSPVNRSRLTGAAQKRAQISKDLLYSSLALIPFGAISEQSVATQTNFPISGGLVVLIVVTDKVTKGKTVVATDEVNTVGR